MGIFFLKDCLFVDLHVDWRDCIWPASVWDFPHCQVSALDSGLGHWAFSWWPDSSCSFQALEKSLLACFIGVTLVATGVCSLLITNFPTDRQG